MSNLKHYLRLRLDVMFVALNPPTESNDNGHYFSGRNSRFFRLLYLSGLITQDVPKLEADTIVFGSTRVNHHSREFGVVDLIGDVVQTKSGKVQPKTQHVEALFTLIRQYKPRFVCVIHSKVRVALASHPDISTPLQYGICGPLLCHSESVFVQNYFPNGNNIPDRKKLEIFRALRDVL